MQYGTQKKRKRKAIEHRFFEAETSVGDIDDISEYDSSDSSKETIDKIEMEKLVYFLPVEESTILLLKHIGYKSNEICKIMGLQTMKQYYGFHHNMKVKIQLYKMLHNVKQ